jgi:hypothetical protein
MVPIRSLPVNRWLPNCPDASNFLANPQNALFSTPFKFAPRNFKFDHPSSDDFKEIWRMPVGPVSGKKYHQK